MLFLQGAEYSCQLCQSADAHLDSSGPSASQSDVSCCATLYLTRQDLSCRDMQGRDEFAARVMMA